MRRHPQTPHVVWVLSSLLLASSMMGCAPGPWREEMLIHRSGHQVRLKQRHTNAPMDLLDPDIEHVVEISRDGGRSWTRALRFFAEGWESGGRGDILPGNRVVVVVRGRTFYEAAPLELVEVRMASPEPRSADAIRWYVDHTASPITRAEGALALASVAHNDAQQYLDRSIAEHESAYLGSSEAKRLTALCKARSGMPPPRKSCPTPWNKRRLLDEGALRISLRVRRQPETEHKVDRLKLNGEPMELLAGSGEPASARAKRLGDHVAIALDDNVFLAPLAQESAADHDASVPTAAKVDIRHPQQTDRPALLWLVGLSDTSPAAKKQAALGLLEIGAPEGPALAKEHLGDAAPNARSSGTHQ